MSIDSNAAVSALSSLYKELNDCVKKSGKFSETQKLEEITGKELSDLFLINFGKSSNENPTIQKKTLFQRLVIWITGLSASYSLDKNLHKLQDLFVKVNINDVENEKKKELESLIIALNNVIKYKITSKYQSKIKEDVDELQKIVDQMTVDPISKPQISSNQNTEALPIEDQIEKKSNEVFKSSLEALKYKFHELIQSTIQTNYGIAELGDLSIYELKWGSGSSIQRGTSEKVEKQNPHKTSIQNPDPDIKKVSPSIQNPEIKKVSPKELPKAQKTVEKQSLEQTGPSQPLDDKKTQSYFNKQGKCSNFYISFLSIQSKVSELDASIQKLKNEIPEDLFKPFETGIRKHITQMQKATNMKAFGSSKTALEKEINSRIIALDKLGHFRAQLNDAFHNEVRDSLFFDQLFVILTDQLLTPSEREGVDNESKINRIEKILTLIKNYKEGIQFQGNDPEKQYSNHQQLQDLIIKTSGLISKAKDFTPAFQDLQKYIQKTFVNTPVDLKALGEAKVNAEKEKEVQQKLLMPAPKKPTPPKKSEVKPVTKPANTTIPGTHTQAKVPPTILKENKQEEIKPNSVHPKTQQEQEIAVDLLKDDNPLAMVSVPTQNKASINPTASKKIQDPQVSEVKDDNPLAMVSISAKGKSSSVKVANDLAMVSKPNKEKPAAKSVVSKEDKAVPKPTVGKPANVVINPHVKPQQPIKTQQPVSKPVSHLPLSEKPQLIIPPLKVHQSQIGVMNKNAPSEIKKGSEARQTEEFNKLKQLADCSVNRYSFAKMHEVHERARNQYRVSLLYGKGIGTAQNHKMAEDYLKKAADDGNINAQLDLAKYLLELNGNPNLVTSDEIEKNQEKAFKLCQEAANAMGMRREYSSQKTIAEAQCLLGHLYVLGCGVQKNVDAGVNLYIKASKYSPEATYFLGCAYANGISLGKNLKEAFKLFELAAENGISAAQYNLGLCYERGEGVAKDLDKAFTYYQKAIETNPLGAIQDNVLNELQEKDEFEEVEDEEPVVPDMWYPDAAASWGIKTGIQALNQMGTDSSINISVDPNKTKEIPQTFIGNADYKLGSFYETRKDMKQAISHYEKAAQEGSKEALLSLGRCYEKGNGVKKDLEKALQYYHLAAEQGFLDGIVQEARCYEEGIGTEVNIPYALELYHLTAKCLIEKSLRSNLKEKTDFTKEPNAIQAFSILTKAAKYKDPKSLYLLGNAYARGIGVSKNEVEAFHVYRKAAQGNDANDAAAFVALGKCYEQGIGTTADSKKAFENYTKAEVSGLPAAFVALGKCYEQGIGVEQNKNTAFSYYQKAAQKNYQGVAGKEDPAGLFELGRCYSEGIGVDADPEKAVEYYQQSADKQYPLAWQELGFIYANGIVGDRDHKKSLECYGKAAYIAIQKGMENSAIVDSEIENKLAQCYEQGIGVTSFPMPVQAFQWYERGANEGNANSMMDLGRCYGLGIGTEKNTKKALEWLNKALENGAISSYVHLYMAETYDAGSKSDLALNHYLISASQWNEPAILHLRRNASDKEDALNIAKGLGPIARGSINRWWETRDPILSSPETVLCARKYLAEIEKNKFAIAELSKHYEKENPHNISAVQLLYNTAPRRKEESDLSQRTDKQVLIDWLNELKNLGSNTASRMLDLQDDYVVKNSENAAEILAHMRGKLINIEI